jgi:hypothetical protein
MVLQRGVVSIYLLPTRDLTLQATPLTGLV